MVALRGLDAVHHHPPGGARPRPPLHEDGGLVRGGEPPGWGLARHRDGRLGRGGPATGADAALLAAAACATCGARRGSRCPPGRFPPARPSPSGQRALARPVPPVGLRGRLRLADRRRARHLHQDGGALPDDRPGRADGRPVARSVDWLALRAGARPRRPAGPRRHHRAGAHGVSPALHRRLARHARRRGRVRDGGLACSPRGSSHPGPPARWWRWRQAAHSSGSGGAGGPRRVRPSRHLPAPCGLAPCGLAPCGLAPCRLAPCGLAPCGPDGSHYARAIVPDTAVPEGSPLPIRLLLADVDGTLVTHDKILTDRAIAAVHHLPRRGRPLRHHERPAATRHGDAPGPARPPDTDRRLQRRVGRGPCHDGARAAHPARGPRGPGRRAHGLFPPRRVALPRR